MSLLPSRRKYFNLAPLRPSRPCIIAHFMGKEIEGTDLSESRLFKFEQTPKVANIYTRRLEEGSSFDKTSTIFTRNQRSTKSTERINVFDSKAKRLTFDKFNNMGDKQYRELVKTTD